MNQMNRFTILLTIIILFVGCQKSSNNYVNEDIEWIETTTQSEYISSNPAPNEIDIRWDIENYFLKGVDEEDGVLTIIETPQYIQDINECSCRSLHVLEGKNKTSDWTFLCPRKSLENKDNLRNWNDFCSCVQVCTSDSDNMDNLTQEELELNCSDYCSSYADETEGYAN